jgi:succinoglycan biosynthesis transport protein ExoP
MYFGPAQRTMPQYQLPSGLPTSEPPAQKDITGAFGTLLRRKRAFIAIFLGFFSLVVLLTLIVPKTYTSEIKLIAGASSPTGPVGGTTDTTLPLLNALLAASNTMSAETYVDLIQQYPVAEQVIKDLNLPTDPYSLLHNNISVTPVTNTSIIALDASWGDRNTAIKIANDFGNVFVERERELIAGQASSAIDFLSKQLPAAQATMQRADAALAQFETKHPNVYLSGADSQSELTSVFAAQQKYAQAQVDRDQAQAQLNNITAQMRSMSPTINGQSSIVQNPVSAQLQAQLAQVEVQLDTARKQYTEQHPVVQALEQQKAQLEKEIGSQASTVVAGNEIVPNPVYQELSQQAGTLRAQIASDQAQLNTLRQEMGQNNRGESLPAETLQLANLQRNAKMAEDVYTALQQKYGEATVAQTTALSDVAITQPAAPDTTKVKPNWELNLVLGLILGLVMAASGAFLIDFFDNTFKNEEDVQRVLPLPLLASIPKLTESSPSKLPWLRALTVESFLQLVTALRYSSDKPLATLAVTSPNEQDGKTTVAMSTAIAMAEIEPKVLLVDADFRHPALHKRLKGDQTPGLSDVLVGDSDLSAAIQPTKYDGLFLLAAGTTVPNPVKLIHSLRFDEVLARLRKDFRVVIFDTPALQPVYDGALVASKVDGTVLVVSAGLTDMPSTNKALQRLGTVSGVNLLGVVLNRATPQNGYATYYLNTSNTPLPHEEEIAARS